MIEEYPYNLVIIGALGVGGLLVHGFIYGLIGKENYESLIFLILIFPIMLMPLGFLIFTPFAPLTTLAVITGSYVVLIGSIYKFLKEVYS
jgi:hypothetical protein